MPPTSSSSPSTEAQTAPERTRPARVRQRSSVAIIGVGNALRHDDAAGLETVRRLRPRAKIAGIPVHEQERETLALLEIWEHADAVVLVDAIHSGATVGTIHRFDATFVPLPTRLRGSSSTHAVAVGEAIELARALGRLPKRIVLFGVEGARFDAGSGLSEEVQAAIPALAAAVLREASELAA